MLASYVRFFFAFLFCSFLIQTTRSQCVGNFDVATSTGESVVNICVGNASPIVRVAAGIRGYPIMYVVTDDNGTILATSTNPVFNFAAAPPGVCRIYAATFKGRLLNVEGQQLDDAVLTSLCAELSDNYVTIIRGSADQSTVSISGGGLDTTVCSQDGSPDIVHFEGSGVTTSYAFVITDELGNILGVTNDQADFEGAPAGTCFVYGLSYDGALLAAPGLSINDQLAEGCYLLSDNRIEVNRITTEAGVISTSDGTAQEVVCVGDGIDDIISFISPGADTGANFSFIVTNDQDTILGLPPGNEVNFEGAGVGVCRVYGVAYTGNLNAAMGQALGDISSDGSCLGITQNYVEIIRTSPTEGRIETTDGDTVVYTCPGDGIDDIVSVNLLSGGNPTVFIITDENNVVLGLSPNQNINFEGAGEGVCFIWRSAYTGTLTIEIGDTLFVDAVSNGCSAVSDNAVEVRRVSPEAGEITTAAGETSLTLCVGDGDDDAYTFDAQFNPNASFAIVITNDSNQVLAIVGINDTVNFEGAGAGTCLVYGLSYNGDLLLSPGDDLLSAPLASACADLSDNYVEVMRTDINPGVIVSQYGTVAFTCPGDGVSDEIIITQQSGGVNSFLIITDNQGVVLAFPDSDTIDLEGAGEGVCLIWSMAFEGNLLIQLGDTIQGQPLASGCFSLSDPVFVIRRVPTTDTLATVDGETEVEFCTEDGQDDLLILNYGPSADFPIEYVITDTVGTILGISSNDTINFEGVPEGVCRVYGVAYTGLFTADLGQNISSTDLSDDCYAISENYVNVIRRTPDGGEVTLPDGSGIIYTCPGDGIADIVHFMRTGGSADAFEYVITDEYNVILALPGADSANFDGAPVGTCRVWGLAYTGNIIAQVGDTASRVPLSDQCFGLSSSFIEVVRDTAAAGSIETTMGETSVNVSTTDTIPDVVTVQAIGASSAASMFLVTNESDIILVMLNGNTVDFGQVPAGEYRIYHVSFTGNLTTTTGFNVLNDAISDGCYDVSSNAVIVTVSDALDKPEDELARPGNGDAMVTQLEVFPNPAIDEISFRATENTSHVAIVDQMGRTVIQRPVENQGLQYIPVTELSNGHYILVSFEGNRMLGQQQFIILK